MRYSDCETRLDTKSIPAEIARQKHMPNTAVRRPIPYGSANPQNQGTRDGAASDARRQVSREDLGNWRTSVVRGE